jgi:diaminopimelate epimerase
MILRVTSVQHVGSHRLKLSFNDGTQQALDVYPLLSGPIFEPLKRLLIKLNPNLHADFDLGDSRGLWVFGRSADFSLGQFRECCRDVRAVTSARQQSAADRSASDAICHGAVSQIRWCSISLAIMRFTKMHGIGNDYIYVNGFEQHVDDPSAVAQKLSDRHFGIGGDGLILILPSDKADVRMRMFNADGSEAEMCGNGVRCVAKYAYDHGLTRNNPLKVETGRGVLTLALKAGSDGKVGQVTVNMGEPILDLPRIPVDREKLKASRENEYRLTVNPRSGMAVELEATFASMGNPHATIYVNDVKSIDLEKLGPLVENHPAFPRRINAHWVQVHSPSEVTMRTWERGSGITLACGTGACAVCVAGVLTGRTSRKILAHLPGGDLQLEWRESDNCVYMTGPATEVFSGEWRE